VTDAKRYACSSKVTVPGLVPPPKGYAPGQEAFGRPPCARCVREGGITVFGIHRPPEPSVIHPHHVMVERDKRGGVEKTLHKGPREPLCAFHVELVAWEVEGERLGYPTPTWTRGRSKSKHVEKVLKMLAGEDVGPILESPTKAMTPEQCEVEGRLFKTQPLDDIPF